MPMCSARSACRAGVLAALLCLAGAARAQDDSSGADAASSRPWVLGLSAQVDEESAGGVLTSLNWGVAEQTWVAFTAAHSRSPGDRADVTARTLSAGLDHRFGLLGLTFEAELWGDPDALESTDLRGALYIQGERFRLAVERERRDIDLMFTFTGVLDRPVTRSVALSGEGTGARVRLQLSDAWHIYLWGMSYAYSRDLSVLPRVDVLNLLGTSTLTLANSFLDEDYGVGVEWEAGSKLINLSFTRDRSAVDRSELASFNASLLFPLTPRMDLEVNLGRSDSDLFEASLYGGVLLLIYGGS